MKFYILLSLFITAQSIGQVTQFPYYQNFDSSYIITPNLPSGWTSTQNRTSGINDFTTTTSTPNSLPNAIVSTNAKIGQNLISPEINFSGKQVDSIKFVERRSSTHDSGVLLEASTDGGTNFSIVIGDTLKNPGHTNFLQRGFTLPPELNSQSSVKFRWRVIGNGNGTTGTIRFDDILITTKISIDAGITNVCFFPQFLVVRDSLLVTATVKNIGLQAIQHFIFSFYLDLNFDSTAQQQELFSTVTVDTNLNHSDTVQVSSLIPWQGLSELQIISKVEVANDEISTNNQKVTRVIFGVQPFSVVVNEVMYRPTAPEPEWIEITNRMNDSINLKAWKISDRNTGSKSTVSLTDYYLKKDQFVLITKDSANFLETHSNLSARVFVVPTLATFNNDSDAVVLFDQRGKIIDSVNYKSNWGGGSGGKSLERIEPVDPSNQKSNWGTSANPEGATPGKKNSLTPKEFDIVVQRIYFSPTAPTAGDEITINAVVFNIGKQEANNYSIEFYFDSNADSIPQPSELLSQLNSNTTLNPKDSSLFFVQFNLPIIADYQLIVHTTFYSDEDTLNNFQLTTIYAGYKTGTIVINELMYAPIGGEPEWIELFNTSSDTIDLKNWKLSNRNSSSKYTITASSIRINPNNFFVITKDSALFFSRRINVPSPVLQAPSLPTFLFNNNGDAAVLYDKRDAKMDSIFYLPGWGGTEGKSLERIEAAETPFDSSNWGNSPDSTGATPGKQNYLTPLEHDLRVVRIYSNLTLPGEPASIYIVIKNTGKNSASNFIINLFHDNDNDTIPEESELITSATYTDSLARKDSVIVNLTWTNPGHGSKQIIALVDYQEDMRIRDNTIIGLIKISFPAQSLIVNEIMYDPLSGKSEYVELYNRESFPIAIRDWKIHDTPDSSGHANEFKISNSNIVINPGEFCVLAADSTILQQFNYMTNTTGGFHLYIFNKSSLSFNNDGDNVVLEDLTGTVIDSIRFLPNLHNPEIADVNGRALERINPNMPGNDSRNWSTCANPAGGTPGKQNSIFTINIPATSSLSFSPNPFSPDGDGIEDHTIISYNLPAATSMIRIKIFDVRGRLIRTLVNNEPSGTGGQVIWDGMNDERQKARIGIYVVLLEGFDVGGGEVNAIKGVVVLAGKL